MELDTARLVALRVEKGWSQAEVARQAKVNQSYYSAIERGKRHPSGPWALKIADAHGVLLADILPGGES